MLVWVNCHPPPQLLPNSVCYGDLPRSTLPYDSRGLTVIRKLFLGDQWVWPPCEPEWPVHSVPDVWPCQLRQWAPEQERKVAGRQNLPQPLTFLPCVLSLRRRGNATSRLIDTPWCLEGKTQLTDKRGRCRKEKVSPHVPLCLGKRAEIIKNSTLESHRRRQKEGSRPSKVTCLQR